jgi:hypothetical protein
MKLLLKDDLSAVLFELLCLCSLRGRVMEVILCG